MQVSITVSKDAFREMYNSFVDNEFPIEELLEGKIDEVREIPNEVAAKVLIIMLSDRAQLHMTPSNVVLVIDIPLFE